MRNVTSRPHQRRSDGTNIDQATFSKNARAVPVWRTLAPIGRCRDIHLISCGLYDLGDPGSVSIDGLTVTIGCEPRPPFVHMQLPRTT